MIYSENKENRTAEFSSVLDGAVELLRSAAAADAEKYLTSGGTKLEELVCAAISERAKDTEFEGSIALVSGQRFPDLISDGGFGVEVKSTTQNHWRTIGNSVLETTRVKDVERIFLLFGKLADPIDFKVRPYEDCMVDVVVSHYPRYSIDMELASGQTIFDKIHRRYDDVRNSDQLVKLFARYYRSQLKSGGELWWAGGDVKESSVPFAVKLWSDEDPLRRQAIQAKALVLFPEILGSSTTKYSAFAMWLAREFGIISTNVRDIFTAGGQVDFQVGQRAYRNVRKVVALAVRLRQDVVAALQTTNPTELSMRWRCALSSSDGRTATWLGLVRRYVMRTELDLLQTAFLSPSVPIVEI